MAQSLDCAALEQAIKKRSPNRTFIAFVRALARKAGREWLKNRSDDPA
jgi:hypothetical protein